MPVKLAGVVVFVYQMPHERCFTVLREELERLTGLEHFRRNNARKKNHNNVDKKKKKKMLALVLDQ